MRFVMDLSVSDRALQATGGGLGFGGHFGIVDGCCGQVQRLADGELGQEGEDGTFFVRLFGEAHRLANMATDSRGGRAGAGSPNELDGARRASTWCAGLAAVRAVARRSGTGTMSGQALRARMAGALRRRRDR